MKKCVAYQRKSSLCGNYTLFLCKKTKRQIRCSCKGRMLCKLLGIAYIADICFANKEDKSSAPAKSSRICFANKEDI